MSSDDAADRVRRMFSEKAAPEKGAAAKEPATQINVRVPLSVKKRVRVLAARDNLSLSELMLRALELYEQKYGPPPDL